MFDALRAGGLPRNGSSRDSMDGKASAGVIRCTNTPRDVTCLAAARYIAMGSEPPSEPAIASRQIVARNGTPREWNASDTAVLNRTEQNRTRLYTDMELLASVGEVRVSSGGE